MTVGALLAWGIKTLATASTPTPTPTPQLDAQLLMMHLLGWQRHHLMLRDDQELSPDQQTTYEHYIARRLESEPIAYIIGSKPFMGLDFFVGPGVLIPRPDTEVLVEAVMGYLGAAGDRLDDQPGVRIAEIGTGSGAICVSLLVHLAQALPGLEAVGLEISEKAIEITGQNAYSNHVQNRLEVRHSDCFSAVKPGETFDVIVSNPPYISRDDMGTLNPDVADYEPHLALFGGEDGLDFYRRLTLEAPQYLKAGGGLFYEIGYDQGSAVYQLLAERGFSNIVVLKDLAGHDRVVYGLWKG